MSPEKAVVAALRDCVRAAKLLPKSERAAAAKKIAEAIGDAPEEIQEQVLKTLKKKQASHKGH